VSNLYVNARNHGYDPLVFVDTLPSDRILQMHLAGYDDNGRILLDAHGSPVSEQTWQLFGDVQARLPGVPTSIEWDRDVPAFDVLLAERERAEAMMVSKTLPGRGESHVAP
jgi:hypothetical protein